MEHVGNEGDESVNLRREPKAFKIYFEFCSVLDTGSLYNAQGNYSGISIRPVVYLSADIKIIDGDGSEQNPYKLTY